LKRIPHKYGKKGKFEENKLRRISMFVKLKKRRKKEK
jgi:hypothetical protein